MKNLDIYDSKKIVKTMAKSKSGRVMSCRAEHEAVGGYWIADGFVAVKTWTPESWREVGGAIFGEAAGIYSRDNKTGDVQTMPDNKLAGTFTKIAAEKGEIANALPIRFADDVNKRTIAALYEYKSKTVVFVNADYLALFSPDCTFRVTGDKSPVGVYWSDDIVGVIMPITPREENVNAVRAYVGPRNSKSGKSGKPAEAADIAAVRAEYQAAAEKTERENAAHVEKLTARIAELEAELKSARKAAPAPAPAPAQDPASAAHEAVKMFKLINGKIHAVIKGENTGAPVVWLDNVDGIAAADLEKAGAAYSNKRGAWYYRVTARA